MSSANASACRGVFIVYVISSLHTVFVSKRQHCTPI
jgi:hypothetical protein